MLKRLPQFIILITVILSLTACVLEFDNAGGMLAGALKEYKETVELDDSRKISEPMELNMEMQLTRAVVKSTEDKLADVSFLYNSEALKPEFEVEDDEISIKSNIPGFKPGKPVIIWDVKLTDKIPMEVEIKADASDLKLDMGNMQIKSIDAEINASSAKVYFDEPNRASMDKFKVKADASSVSIYGAGNSGFGTLDIDADASRLTVDLTGESLRDGEVRLEANASSVRLKLPEAVGVKLIIGDYEISSVRVNNNDILSRSEKEYVTNNFDNAEYTLKIYADLNVTSLTLE